MSNDKVSKFVVIDDNNNKLIIKHIGDRWHFLVDDESVFSFKVTSRVDNREMVEFMWNLFGEINDMSCRYRRTGHNSNVKFQVFYNRKDLYQS